jgi:hypothetical protein
MSAAAAIDAIGTSFRSRFQGALEDHKQKEF